MVVALLRLSSGGVFIDGKGRNRALPPGAFAVSGRLLESAGQPGVLSQARLSHELHDTGSAILPYVFGEAKILANARPSLA